MKTTNDQKELLDRLLRGDLPDKEGRFGPFGGRYVPETLMPAINKLTDGVLRLLPSENFKKRLNYELKSWVGRPTAMTNAKALSELWGSEVWLKREDLAHTGAHKINNAIGQAILAQELGATRIVAETGAGQHGVASAAACARLGLPCTVYMGQIDIERQAPNVERMYRLGAKVVPVTSGDSTLRAAIDEAMRDWVSDPVNTHYIIGSAVGAHPYPYLVRELQSIIGKEAKSQLEEIAGLPDAIFACVGGGSNAIGLFHPFLGDKNIKLIGIEAGGKGKKLGDNAATLSSGNKTGVLHGAQSILLYDENGQIQETHSVSAGLDYPGVGPEHSFLKYVGRVEYKNATDSEALDALKECCSLEGILPALETAHALAGAKKWSSQNKGSRILIGMSGRGDKDMPILRKYIGIDKDDKPNATV
ncbi:MAG: tryptophan synthase subunit beta [Gammaproteobacteria bacterium TMED78]|nr:MAG: tryptophan synthase subunit beta [Gammaproteobacteria bacterium TMED78]|tara:strand:- start:122045 stop:123301 length:1257 start_codon:yes stop_codon:yes gene_type:complete